MAVKRGVIFGQFKGSRLLIQLGSTAYYWGKVSDHPARGAYYPWRLELLTPDRWLMARRGGYER